jgi:DNA ligase (NAD+)
MKHSEIKNLELEIIRHKNLYYQGKPEISDEQYDKVEAKLKELDPQNEVLNIVGSSVFSSEKIQHNKKMLSLNKTYKPEDIVTWMGTNEIVSTFKIDGSSCSIIYKNGKLNLAKTRGDGKFGENITNKLLCISHVPKILNTYKSEVEVRGEVYCTEENFVKLSQEMEKLGLEKPSSQRNIVAGILGRKENIELSMYLSFQAFELIGDEIILNNESDKFKELIKMGFETPDLYINKTKKDIEDRLEETKDFLANGNYLIDGLVFSYNNLSLHDELGETAHHPRYKIAFKFQGETKTTSIESISWQVSRNGILTPVANVIPVDLSGAMVGRVTLHNYGMVKQFNLKIGDKIEIVRSGEVIPKFLGVIEESTNTFEFPKSCPSCEKEIFIEEIRLICKNDICPDKVKDDILNFIQKIGIDDLSSKRLEEMIKVGLIENITSLYDLTEEKLLSLDKVKEKLTNKILESIEKSKHVDFIVFLSALGISGGAYNKCEKIVLNGYDSPEKVLSLTTEKLMEIESFAEKSSTDFISSLQSKKHIIQTLLDKGFKFKKREVKKDTKISGKKFCITGTLTMKRSDLQKMIKENSGIAVSSVTKATDYLITNDTESSSSKFKKAQELKIPIINEDIFLELIND